MNRSDATTASESKGRERGEVGGVSPEPGTVLAGRFLLRQILGRGGTGTVFAALDQSVGQKVAIKVLHPDLRDERTRERLRREVRSARPGHPNVVTVFDLHERDDHVFLSMELVEGASLREHLQSLKRLEWDEAASIGRQIAAALNHLHERGIVHRDVKPGNIMLSDDGIAKLCDMGLARPVEEGMTVTETAIMVGTPIYMAPEQGIGAQLSPASDIYGLGITLHQCLTGTVPLVSDSAVATLTRRQRERPPGIRRDWPDCPRWLDRLVRRMLEPKPHNRPTAVAVGSSIESERVWPRPRKGAMRLIASIAMLTLAAALIVPRLQTSPTTQVDSDERSVFGRDDLGRTTWSHTLPDPPLGVRTADLDADGRTEIIVAGRPDPKQEFRDSEANRSYVTVLSDDGRVVTDLVPEELIGRWSYPYRRDITPLLNILDLDADGWNEIIVDCRHARFYPSVVLVYWPRWDTWERILLHPGTIAAIASAAEDGKAGFRFVGVNNLLGMTKVYGEIELFPPGSRLAPHSQPSSLMGPPDQLNFTATVGTWRAYVPFGAGESYPSADDRITVDYSPERTIHLASRGPSFDSFVNPIPGPNEGRDLREQRLRFAESLYLLHPGRGAITARGVTDLLVKIRDDAGPIMEEPPYQIVLSNLGARGLAAAGDLDGAMATLADLTNRLYDEDSVYRLAHLQAIAGDLSRSRQSLLNVIDTGVRSRSRFDAPLLLLQVAIRLRDPNEASIAIQFLAVRGYSAETQSGFRLSLDARARLWWDESTEADCDLRIVDLDADGDAIAYLARWRLGRSKPTDITFLEQSIELNPDSYKLGTVALSAALSAAGRADEAITEIENLISGLRTSSRWDFVDHEILELAQAVRVVAYEASGASELAATEALELSDEFDPSFLPGIVIREVLDRTNG